MKKCTLHIGMSKSGTSFIQRSLELNKKKLIENDLYPFYRPRILPACFIEADPHKSIFREMGLTDVDSIKSFQNDRSIVIEKNLDNCTNAIFSSEWLCGFDEQKINSLHSFLKPYFDDFSVIVYFRRQDRYAASLYNLRLITGSTSPEVLMLDDVNSYKYNYLKVLSSWEKYFGKSSLKPRIFDKSIFEKNDLFYDFFGQIEGLNVESLVKPEASNESLTVAAQECLRILNKELIRFKNNRPLKNRKVVVGILKEYFSGRGKLPAREAAKEFQENFEQSNEIMFKRYFNNQCSGFDYSFDEYPVLGSRQFSDRELSRVFDVLINQLSDRGYKDVAKLVNIIWNDGKHSSLFGGVS